MASYGTLRQSKMSTEPSSPAECAPSGPVTLAKCMISDGLGVVSGGPGSESDEALMDTHFHAHDVGTASVVAAKLIATAAALARDVPIDVHGFPMPRLPGDEEVVGGMVPVSPIFGAGDIHLFPAFFQVGAEEQAEIVLHEATHKYIGTVDHAYFQKPEYDKLTVPEALENADSYTELCSLTHGDEERREEEAREEDREATRKVDQELAERHIAEIWASYERMNILLFEDDHTLPDGRVLPPDIVAFAILDWFERTKSSYVEEVYAAWVGGQESGPFWCSDGTVVRWDLYDALINRR